PRAEVRLVHDARDEPAAAIEAHDDAEAARKLHAPGAPTPAPQGLRGARQLERGREEPGADARHEVAPDRRADVAGALEGVAVGHAHAHAPPVRGGSTAASCRSSHTFAGTRRVR